MDATLIGRYDERFGDHAVAAPRRVVFLVTGEQADDLLTEPPTIAWPIPGRSRRRYTRPTHERPGSPAEARTTSLFL